MANVQIPYADSWFVQKEPPRQILCVVTKLPMNPQTAGFSAERKHEMMLAIAAVKGGLHGYDGCLVYSPDYQSGMRA